MTDRSKFVWQTRTLGNGGAVRYREKPREYQVAAVAEDPTWISVPSVTTILEVLSKPALPWWGMRTGVAGVLELLWTDGLRWTPGQDRAEQSVLTTPAFATKSKKKFAEGEWLKPDRPLQTQITTMDGRDEVVDRVTNRLVAAEMSTNHVKEAAGDRGQTVHDAFELWLDSGLLPLPSAYPEHERGYVRAFRSFVEDVDVIGDCESEVMVGSILNLFAGRFDAGVVEDFAGDFVIDRKSGKKQRIEGNVMLDLKTSKRAYATHFLQMKGYEGPMVEEEGRAPFSDHFVLLVDNDGGYELANASRAFKREFTYDHFLAVRHIYDAVGGIL